MAAHQTDRQRLVARRHGIEDRQMFLIQDLLSGLMLEAEHTQPVEPHLLALEKFRDPRITRRCRKCEVKAVIQILELDLPSRHQTGFLLTEIVLQRTGIGRRQAVRAQMPDTGQFDRLADKAGLTDFPLAQLGHEIAPARPRVDKTGFAQLHERLADRRPAGPEAGRHVGLRDQAAGRNVHSHDGQSQGIEDLSAGASVE